MVKDIKQIQEILSGLLKEHIGPLRIRKENEQVLELCGTIETMQGKQKVDGIYFASVVPKPKDIRLYFFPIYTHKDAIGSLSEDLSKMLKGKSCFHIKRLDDTLIQEISTMISKGVSTYQAAGWLAS